MKTGFISIIIFLTSLTLIAYEIILTRILVIKGWQNLSSLIISIAMLGFGASGSLLLLFKNKLKAEFWKKHILFILACYPLSIMLGFMLYGTIPFNPFEIGLDYHQVVYFFFSFFCLSVPFFFGALLIALLLEKFPAEKIYGLNLFGSGIGAVLVIVLSYFFHPYSILILLNIMAFLSFVLFSTQFNLKTFIRCFLTSFILCGLFYFAFNRLELGEASPYKNLSRTLTLPNAKVLKTYYSPLGVISVVEADGLRFSSGLSLLSPFQIPEQKGIFFDGDSFSPITPLDINKNNIRYLDYTPSILPFHLTEKNDSILIVGVGGGEGILKSLLFHFKKIIGIELNPNVIELMQNDFAEFSGNIYLNPSVQIIQKEIRGYIEESRELYDIIDISTIDSFTSASSGVHALNESYLYTVEAFQKFLNHLKPNGILSVTRWMSHPPKDSIKLINLCIEALETLKIKNPGKHIMVIRSVQTITILISRMPFTASILKKASQFANQRLFDILYPVIDANQVLHIKDKTLEFYQAVQTLFTSQRKDLIDIYPFDIAVAIDNRPYYYNFFKSKTLALIFKQGTRKLPFTEWGYLTLIILLIPVLLISFFMILIPLLVKKISDKQLSLPLFFYFTLLGIAFFFIEMPFIQKMTLFLSHPVYSISIILSSLLIFTALGSLFSQRVFPEHRRIFYAVVAIIFITVLYILFLDSIIKSFITENIAIKMVINILLIMPLGFFMGIPFADGLEKLKKINREMIPWVWGINGFFSVIAVLTASIFSILFGFDLLFIISAVCYFIVGIISLSISKRLFD